jgi:AraC-like DNA-binding protein
MPALHNVVVATFLTKVQQDHVDIALGGYVDLLIADSWAELTDLVRNRPVTVVILNPAADGQIDIQPAAELLRKNPSVSIIMYAMLNPASFRAAWLLSKRGLEAVIFQSIDDSRKQLRAIIDEVGSNPRLRYVLRILHPGLLRLPLKLGGTLENLFLAPHKYATANDLASKAGISTLRLYREFQQSGLPSPKKLIVAAKLLHACRFLGDTDQSVATVAKKIGYEDARIFVRHSLRVFGVTPATLRSGLGATTFHRRMLLWLKPEQARSNRRDTRRHA